MAKKDKTYKASEVSKPTHKVSKMSSISIETNPSAATNKFKVSWTVPSGMTSNKKKDWSNKLLVDWNIAPIPYIGLSYWTSIQHKYVSTKTTSSSADLSFSTGGKKPINFNRKSFHPYKKGHLVKQVIASVFGVNKAGIGPEVVKVLSFAAPNKPVIAPIEYNPDNGYVTSSVSVDRDLNGKHEFAQMVSVMTEYDSRTKKTKEVQRKDTTHGGSRSFSYDTRSAGSLGFEHYLQYKITATAQGIMGDTAADPRIFYLSYPAEPQITNIECKSKNPNDWVIVHLKTNATTEHPVDQIELEMLRSSDARTAAEATASDGWTATGIIDNGNCTAIQTTVAACMPEKGTHTWLRLTATHCTEFIRTGAPKEASALFEPAPTADDESVSIISCQSGADGTSIELIVGWKPKEGHEHDYVDDSDGTEVTWSDSPNSWESTSAPNLFEAEWRDKTPRYSGYRGTARIYIADLVESQIYYVRVRRYKEYNGVKTYTDYSDDYSNIQAAIPSTKPTNVELIVPAYICEGEDFEASWTFNSPSIQKSWGIQPSNKLNVYLSGGPIDNSLGSCVVDYAEAIEKAGRIESSTGAQQIALIASISTGGEFAHSSEKVITVVKKPEGTIDAGDIYTMQPIGFNVFSSDNDCDILYKVYSLGSSGSAVIGDYDQLENDVVVSGALRNVEWLSKEDVVPYQAYPSDQSYIYGYNFILQTSAEFYDGATYMIEITLSNRTTGMQSSVLEASFNIAWGFKAKAISYESVGIESSRQVRYDEDGNFIGDTYQSTLSLPSPTEEDIYTLVQYPRGNPATNNYYELNGSDYVLSEDTTIVSGKDYYRYESEMFDIYRHTPDGYDLFASNISPDTEVIDVYSPYSNRGNISYLIATRTADYDFEVTDVEYDFYHYAVRFDWGSEYLDLPYNLVFSDTYDKDFDQRVHIDGSVAGHWNNAALRSSTITSNFIRLDEVEQQEKVRSLATYPGVVFVRTPAGTAFAANVEVKNLEDTYNDPIMTVSFEITAVDTTSDFQIIGGSVEEPEEEPEP